MSASDLAPFVAAVLRDKVLKDATDDMQQLRAENQRLRAKVDILASVPKAEIVDKNNGTVYLSGKFGEEGTRFTGESCTCVVNDNAIDQQPNRLSQLFYSYLRVSGRFWHDLLGPGSSITVYRWDGNFKFGFETDELVQMMVALGEEEDPQKYRTLIAGRRINENTQDYPDFPVADILAVYGDSKVTMGIIWVLVEDMVMRRPAFDA